MSEGDAFEKKGSSSFFSSRSKAGTEIWLRKDMIVYEKPREFDVRCDTCPTWRQFWPILNSNPAKNTQGDRKYVDWRYLVGI